MHAEPRFPLGDPGAVVAHLALYAIRRRRRTHGRCATWGHGASDDLSGQGLRLLRALLAQPGYHFTDLSPSGNVVALNRRLRFEALDTATALVPNLPLPRFPAGGGMRLISDPHEMRTGSRIASAALYDDHVGAAASRHLALVRDGRLLRRLPP